MSADIRDFRKFTDEKAAQRAMEDFEKPKPLVPQVESASANTGEARFDKLIRSIEALVQPLEAHATEVSVKGMGCVQDEMLKLQQFDYFYTKGRADGLKEAAALPARILAEEKSFS